MIWHGWAEVKNDDIPRKRWYEILFLKVRCLSPWFASIEEWCHHLAGYWQLQYHLPACITRQGSFVLICRNSICRKQQMDLGSEFIVFKVTIPVLPVGIEHEKCSHWKKHTNVPEIHKHSNIWAMLPWVPSEYHNLHGISSEQQRDCRYRVFFLQFCSSLYTFADEHNLASTIFFSRILDYSTSEQNGSIHCYSSRTAFCHESFNNKI